MDTLKTICLIVLSTIAFIIASRLFFMLWPLFFVLAIIGLVVATVIEKK